MNKRIDFSTMPKVFGMCNMADCPQAETCLRHLAYEVADADRPFIDTLNPRWLAKHKGLCRFYLINETVKRPRGFIRTLKALPTGKADSFRLSAMAKMGYRRYYQTRKGEIKWWTQHLSGESEQGDNDGFAQGLQGQSDEIKVVLKIADLGFKNTLLFL